MAGRRPKPSALKELQGNPGRRPLSSAEPAPDIIRVPPRAPRCLGPVGQAKWRDLMPRLIRSGIPTEIDLDALTNYCRAAEVLHIAEEDIAAHGRYLSGLKGGRYLNPAAGDAWAAIHEMSAIGREFGMTPASRTKVRAANPKQRSLFDSYLEDEEDADRPDPLLN